MSREWYVIAGLAKTGTTAVAKPVQHVAGRLCRQRPTDRKKRRIFPIRQQYSRSLDPACRLGSRLRYRSQLRRILIAERQFNRPPPRRHDFNPAPLWVHAAYMGIRKPQMNPSVMTTFMESNV